MSAQASAELDKAMGSTTTATRALRYTTTAVVLHWTIAALVLLTIPLGLYGATVESDAAQQITNAHKLLGIVVLALTLVRIGWRLSHRPPALPATMAPTLRTLAGATHVMFYILLLALPLSGWWMTSAFPGRHPIGFEGVLEVPFLPVELSMASASAAHGLHENLGFIAIALIVLHVTATLKHHFVDRDDILGRMSGRR